MTLQISDVKSLGQTQVKFKDSWTQVALLKQHMIACEITGTDTGEILISTSGVVKARV